MLTIITLPSNTTRIKYNNNGTVTLTTIDGKKYISAKEKIILTTDGKLVAEVKK